MKPGIQERERECGECKKCLECSLGLLEISNRIPRNEIIVRLKEMFKKFPENLQQITGIAWKDLGKCTKIQDCIYLFLQFI